MNHYLGNRSRQFLLLTFFICAGLGTQYFGLMKRLSFSDEARLAQVEVPYMPPRAVLRVLSLGYPAFLSDLLFIRASLYFSEHLLSDRKFEWLELYLYAAQNLDPRNFWIYRYGALNLKLGEYVITYKNLMKSIALAEKGLDYFPNQWWLYEHIGWQYLFQMSDLQEFVRKPPSAAQLREWEEKGIQYYRIASELNPDEVDPGMLTRILTRRGRIQASINHVMSTYLGITNPVRRKELADQLRQLNVTQIAEELEALVRRWEKDMPYIDVRDYIQLDAQIQLSEHRSWRELVHDLRLGDE
ncbi:MAG: hypothetical protein KC609_02610 [Myxococcales bacterium]|nr:hypothetical protein [Myxococcales bacterium]